VTDDLHGSGLNEEVSRRLQAAAALVDPLADELGISALRETSPARRRLRAPRVALVAAVCLSLALAGTLVGLAGRSASPSKRIRPASPPPIRVDLAATPKGWFPVDYGDLQLSVPGDWLVVTSTRACPSESVITAMEHVAPVKCHRGFLVSNVPVLAVGGAHFLTSTRGYSERRLMVNGIEVVVESPPRSGETTVAVVPSLGVGFEWRSPKVTIVIRTVTWSPRAALLTRGAPARTPTSWRSTLLDGVELSVPGSWTRHTGSWVPNCDPTPFIFPVGPRILEELREDEKSGICGGPGVGEANSGLVPFAAGPSGVVAVEGPTAATLVDKVDTPLTCRRSRSLQVCIDPGSGSTLLMSVSQDGVVLMAIELTLRANGVVDREIYDSIRPAGTPAPGAVEPKEQGQLYLSALAEMQRLVRQARRAERGARARARRPVAGDRLRR
jgi:hypothetical protein